MKKKVCLILTIMMTLTMGTVGFAQEKSSIENNVTEIIEMGDSVKVEVQNLETGVIEEVALTDCTKTIETYVLQNSDGSTRNRVTVEGILELPAEDGNTENASARAGDTNWDYDDGVAFKATLTIEYDIGYNDEGFETYLLTYVEGNWENIDNAFSIYDKTFDVSCFGASTGTGLWQQDTDMQIDDDEYEFSFDTGYDEPIPENDPTAYIGAAMEGTVSRNSGYEYVFRHKNML